MPRNYICQEKGCKFKSIWKENLKRHIKTDHSNEIYYKCAKCNFETNRRDKLTQHEGQKHDMILHECGECEFKSAWPENLKRHKKITGHKG